MALIKLGPIDSYCGTHGHFYVVLKLAIWCGSAKDCKSISAKIKIYTNASCFQS